MYLHRPELWVQWSLTVQLITYIILVLMYLHRPELWVQQSLTVQWLEVVPYEQLVAVLVTQLVVHS